MQKSEKTWCVQIKCIWNPTTASFHMVNGKCLGNIIDDLVIMCNEIIDTAKTVPRRSTSTETIPAKSA